jgi:hypothetical protein
MLESRKLWFNSRRPGLMTLVDFIFLILVDLLFEVAKRLSSSIFAFCLTARAPILTVPDTGYVICMILCDALNPLIS